MQKLNISLQNKTSYINSLNLFSRSLLFKEVLYDKKSLLVICENEKIISEYKKILNFLNINSGILEKYNDFANLFYNMKGLYFCIPEYIQNSIYGRKNIKNTFFELYIGQDIKLEHFIEILNDLGYKFSSLSSPGTYKKNGDLIIVFSFCSNYQFKISFWGDKLDEIYISEIFSGLVRNTSKVDKIYLGSVHNVFDNKKTKNTTSLLDFLSSTEVYTILDNLDFTPYYDNIVSKLNNFSSLDFVGNKLLKIKDLGFDSLNIDNIHELKNFLSKTKNIYLITKSKKVVDNFVEFNNLSGINIIETKLSNLKSFFIKSSDKKIAFICDDIIGKVFVKKRIKKNISVDIDLLLKINPGDYIVHIDHGVGIFNGIIKKTLGLVQKEYIEILYKDNDKLFVPIIEISRVNKYVGVENPKLTGLNTKQWENKIKRASIDAQKIAEELLELHSKRKISKGFSFIIDSKKVSEFQSSFPYNYTEDQMESINNVFIDMEKDIPMDRLIIGDVGFGKTEIAFNAIFTSFLNKKQSIMISPLVVLAYEHYEKAISRFRQFGMNIAILTRLESTKNINSTIKRLKSGEVDLLIGTHRLLSKDIIYKDLGLMVIDEEHKFGVNDKEKIKKLKSKVDILSMSATPIPRSLNMAISSLRSMSIIKNPPFGRKPIETIVSKFNENIISQACEKEFSRGGQVFFVHNRVSNIEHFKKLLLNLFPEKRVIVTHGQLPGEQLEKRIIDFKNKKYDVLLSTTVIENGIDFPNVNTIFINDAYRFGISQIHQLRGRVGRSEKKGYCYLLYKSSSMKTDSIQRLKTIVNYSYLGAGFELAMKDLEIRGGGDILGIRQSGQNSDIGINLYLKMIEDKIEELKTKKSLQEDIISGKINSTQAQEKIENSKKINTSIDLNISAFIPGEYFSSELDKINFYREIELIDSLEDLKSIIEDFKILNNNFSLETNNFFELLELKLKAQEFKIKSIKRVLNNYQLDFIENLKIEQLKKFLDLDKEVKFSVIKVSRIRTPVKSFKNELDFAHYLLKIFDKKIGNRKIRLKK